MTPKVEIFTRNLELTERINEYVQKKVDKFNRFLNDIDDIRVDMTFSKSARNAAARQVAEITIRGRGFILRVEERADDIFSAIDAAVDKMQRQIERYKGKRQRGRGEGKPVSILTEEQIPAEIEEEKPIIVRRKQFILVPMNELEAIDQMALLGHEDFFVFYNADSNAINVLYRRRDDTYGLIETQVG
jgi:putative sigma-54 modulation protein